MITKTALSNMLGWRTRRRLVVFQSDDWFAIRTSSNSALDALRKLGARVEDCHYMLFDHLETGSDLEALFGVLARFTDTNGRHAVLTANCLAANPDFEKIEESGFREYYAESSLATTESAPGCKTNLSIWRQAIQQRVCFPQSHGREHLNVPRWMEALRSGDPVVTTAFAHRMFGVSSHITVPRRTSVMAAFDYPKDRALSKQSVVSEALQKFQEIFGYRSRSFIAPNYLWDDEVEQATYHGGVHYLQSARVQSLPADESGQKRRCRRFQGQGNKLGQHYIVRNVDFEPSSDRNVDWVGRSLRDMDIAFKLRKPAVVSTHRVNFVGVLSQSNRDKGLASLEHLLGEMLKLWPDLEFVNTVELGDIMSGRGPLS